LVGEGSTYEGMEGRGGGLLLSETEGREGTERVGEENPPKVSVSRINTNPGQLSLLTHAGRCHRAVKICRSACETALIASSSSTCFVTFTPSSSLHRATHASALFIPRIFWGRGRFPQFLAPNGCQIVCSESFFSAGTSNELQIYHGSFLFNRQSTQELFVIKQSKGCKLKGRKG